MYRCLYLILLCIILYATAEELPTYFDKCNASSPTLNECVKESGNKGILEVVRGDKHYNVPPMNPLLLYKITLKNSDSLKFIMRNVRIYGFDRTKITNAYMNFSQPLLALQMYTPTLVILTNYEINGTLLNQTIYGAGRLNVTFVQINWNISAPFKIDKNKFVYFYSPVANQTFGDISTHFSNLYDGNETLGKRANNIINKNWRAVMSVFIEDTNNELANIITSIILAYTDLVPLDKMYLW